MRSIVYGNDSFIYYNYNVTQYDDYFNALLDYPIFRTLCRDMHRFDDTELVGDIDKWTKEFIYRATCQTAYIFDEKDEIIDLDWAKLREIAKGMPPRGEGISSAESCGKDPDFSLIQWR